MTAMLSRITLGKRPTLIPFTQVDRAQQNTSTGNQLIGPDWLICNAPRPIFGHVEWRGEFISGTFYAAINPAGERADAMISHNENMKAVILDYWTMKQVREWLWDFYSREYPGEVAASDLAEMSDMQVYDAFCVNRGDK